MSADHLVDCGVSGGGNRGTEYWPSPPQAVQSSWWKTSNWFRHPSDADNNAIAATESADTANIISDAVAAAPGSATVFNRFTASEAPAQSVAVVTKRRRRRALSAVRGYSLSVLTAVAELIRLPLTQPKLFTSIGVSPSRGLLLLGGSGSGKTRLVKTLANELAVYFRHVDGADILAAAQRHSAVPSQSSTDYITAIFNSARANAPAIVFIDDVDNIASTPSHDDSPLLQQLRGSLRRQLDTLVTSSQPIIVIAATSRPSVVDPSFLRHGRFEKTIELNKPDESGRLHMLTAMTKDMKLSDVDLTDIARRTDGFVGADLQALCSEAGLVCIRNVLNSAHDSDDHPVPVTASVIATMSIRQNDFESALAVIKPSTSRPFADVSATKWSDVGGDENVKSIIVETIQYPLRHPKLFQRYGLTKSSGLLLYGPPGTGKSLMAKAIADDCHATLIYVKGPELLSSYLGQSEKAIRDIFASARAAAPAVLFFDEIDSIAITRSTGQTRGDATADRILNTLLIELETNDAKQQIFVVAATNRPERIDRALLRPGRFDHLVYVGLPDITAREAIIRTHLKGAPTADDIDDAFIASVAAKTDRFSGADIAGAIHQAKRIAIRECISQPQNDSERPLNQRHLDAAFATTVPSVTDEALQQLNVFNKQLQLTSQEDDESDDDNDEDMSDGKESEDDEKKRNDLSNLRASIRADAESAINSGATAQQALNQILQKVMQQQAKSMKGKGPAHNDDDLESKKVDL